MVIYWIKPDTATSLQGTSLLTCLSLLTSYFFSWKSPLSQEPCQCKRTQWSQLEVWFPLRYQFPFSYWMFSFLPDLCSPQQHRNVTVELGQSLGLMEPTFLLAPSKNLSTSSAISSQTISHQKLFSLTAHLQAWSQGILWDLHMSSAINSALFSCQTSTCIPWLALYQKL